MPGFVPKAVPRPGNMFAQKVKSKRRCEKKRKRKERKKKSVGKMTVPCVCNANSSERVFCFQLRLPFALFCGRGNFISGLSSWKSQRRSKSSRLRFSFSFRSWSVSFKEGRLFLLGSFQRLRGGYFSLGSFFYPCVYSFSLLLACSNPALHASKTRVFGRPAAHGDV